MQNPSPLSHPAETLAEVRAHDQVMRYRRAGAGRPLLVLRRATDLDAFWPELDADLVARFRVVTPELPALEYRDRFQRIYVDALMELGARLVAEVRHAKAAEPYRRVLALDELHEEALLALMKCHVALGERSQALRVYRRFADRMREELDAEPDDDTTSFFEKLQQGAGV